MDSANLPHPWDEQAIDEIVAVARCGAFVAGRMPRNAAETIGRWFEETSVLLGEFSSRGWTLPTLEVVRFDPETMKASESPCSTAAQRSQIDALLGKGLDGSLELRGHLSGPPPSRPFIYQWRCVARLDPPDWFSLHLGVEMVRDDTGAAEPWIRSSIVDLLRRSVSAPWVHYAEAGPGLPGHSASTPWEDSVEQNTMGEGARLAPMWLRGLAPATFVHDQLMVVLGGRDLVKATDLGVEVEDSPNGVLLVAPPGLWREEAWQDPRLRSLFAGRMVSADLLLELRVFSADFEGSWVDGPTADAIDQHFREFDSSQRSVADEW